MNRPKKQHFVPVLHLKHFTGHTPPGMIWTYDMQGAEPRPSIPEETGLQSNFYSVKDKDGKHVDILENWLADVEAKAAPIYETLLKGKIPKDQERADFAVFLSSSYVRSPRLINQYAETYGKFVQIVTRKTAENPEVFEAMLKRMEKERGPIDPKVRPTVRDFILDTNRYRVEVSRSRGLPALGLSDKLVEFLFAMTWAVLDSGTVRLITCDGPLAKFAPHESWPPLGDGGFVNRHNTFTYPLSPSKCLFIEWGDGDKDGLVAMPREMTRWCNHERAHSAWRYLYSSTKNDGVRRLGLKHHDRGPRFVTSFDDRVAEVKVRR